MFNPIQGRLGSHLRELAMAPGLAVAELIEASTISEALERCDVRFRDRIFNPTVTLWAFLWQLLDAGGSCGEAVARVLAWRIRHEMQPCSANTGSYCQARARLPFELIRYLLRHVAERLRRGEVTERLWKGRHVKVVDGTTVSMPDTPANQRVYPQAGTQKTGLGFPIARMVVVFSLYSGAALDVAMGPYRGKKTGENSLFRSLLGHIQPREVIVADRCFSGYCDVALMIERDADALIRKHQCRQTDLRHAKRLGKDDYLVTWRKPDQCPAGLDRQVFDRLPQQMHVRELTLDVGRKGYRTRRLTLVTTLSNPDEYSAAELAELYACRWAAELDLRSLKTTLHMDVLQCKSPEMVRKEVWMHMLAYNLVRAVMAQAAEVHGRDPSRLSFSATLHLLRVFHAAGLLHHDHAPALLLAIVQAQVPARPGRIEPRAVKRRPKPHKQLQLPREQARQELLR